MTTFLNDQIILDDCEAELKGVIFWTKDLRHQRQLITAKAFNFENNIMTCGQFFIYKINSFHILSSKYLKLQKSNEFSLSKMNQFELKEIKQDQIYRKDA